MGQFRQITRTLTLEATGGADTLRCWDVPTSMPLKQITMILSTKGEITAAGDLDWDVRFGGKWAGTPYASGSNHSGGVSQATGTIAGGTEICHVIHSHTGFIPVNNPVVPVRTDNHGFPIVVELVNDKASPVTIYVTFVSETISTNV